MPHLYEKKNGKLVRVRTKDKAAVKHHPVTGCRMDTVYGTWLVAADVLEQWRDTGWAVLEHGELRQTQARSGELAAAANENPFVVQDGIARLSIAGPMTKFDTSLSAVLGGTSTMRTRKALATIAKLKAEGKVSAAFIDVDSGGGTVEGTAELAASIRKLSAVMPVFVHAEDTAASAALWVATQGTRFTCGPAAKVGSLGIRSELLDASKAGQDSTVKPIVIDSGKYKSIGAPGKPITPDQRAEMDRFVNALAAVFRGDVQSARKMNKAQIEEAATARVFIGKDAVRVGLCDAICTTDEAYDYAKAHMNDTPQPVRRGPGEGKPPPAAPRSRNMLTDSQVAKVQEFAGTQMVVTADNADGIAFQLLANSRADITRLTQELADARKTGKTSASAMDGEVLRSRCEAAVERVQLLMDKGKITGGSAMALMNSFLTAGKVDKNGVLSDDAAPIEALFVKTEGKFPYQNILAAFDDAKPNALNKTVAGDQPAPRDVPGEEKTKFAATNTGTPMTLAEANKVRAAAHLPLYDEAQFKAAFPELSSTAAA